MTTWTIPVREYTTEQVSYYEDQYHKLKSEKDDTARRLNGLDDANRMLKTKCAQLETFKKKMMDGEVDKGQLAESFGSMSKHDKNSYDDLFKAYDILQRQHRSLIAKNKSYLQHIEKLKKEVQTAKLRFGAPRLKNNRASNSIIKPNNGDSVEVASVDNKENVERSNVDTALAQLQSRLNSAEVQLTALKSNPLASDSKTANEAATKLHLLESQRELDQSRIQTQTEKLEKILHLHKEYKARYGALKKQLHQYQEHNEGLEVRVAEIEDCKEQVAELSEHNRFLEEKMLEMCKVAEPDEEANQRVRVLAQQMEEKQREYELLTKENKELREQMTKRIGDVWQQLDQQRIKNEVELQHANQMLQDEAAKTQALRKQLQESTDGLNRGIICHERKIEELSSKAVQRLQRIRMLEAQTTIERTSHAMRSERINATLQEAGRNNVEIAVHGASLTGVLEGTKSFILLDFHSFASELSGVASGVNPNYDFVVTYKITEADDGALSHLLAGSFVRVELYVLREETSPPTLVASTTIPTSALLNPLAQVRSSALELTPPLEGGAVGRLDLSMRLARPIAAIHTPPRMMDNMAVGGQRAVPDAITISVISANLSRGKVLFGSDDPFYVHYRFIARDVTTNLARADSRGAISFLHTSSFPILSADDGSIEPVLWALSKVTVQFTLFTGGRRENERGEWEEEEEGGYRIVGRARVPLSDVWIRANTTATVEIISQEAKIVGSMAVTIEASARPAFGVDSASRDSMRRSARSSFAELLAEVVSTIENEDPNGTVGANRLLRFIDPPAGILNTAENIRRLMVARFGGKSLSDVVLSPHPPRQPGDDGEGKTSASEYARRIEDARCRGTLPPGFPPDEEVGDLLRHLSDGDGRMTPSDLDSLVALGSVRTLAETCRALGRTKGRDVGADLRAAAGGRRAADAATWRRELNACATELFDGLSDEELIHLSPLIRDLSR